MNDDQTADERVRSEEPPAQARLAEALDSHRLWLETEGVWGTRADLAGADLTGCDLRGARLARAALAGACLARARIEGADLSGCDLAGADLSGAVLDDANLCGADLGEGRLDGASLARCTLAGAKLTGVRGLTAARLRDADLSETRGLVGRDLAGADLTGVRLPADLARFGQLDQIGALSGIARPLFLFVLATTTFLALTVFSTPDVALFTNAPSAVLPNLSSHIPAASLFWVSPIVLLLVFSHLQVYVSRLWAPLAELPAVFPDGTALERRAHAWMVVRLVRLRDGIGAAGVRDVFTLVLLWGTVPAALLAIWWRYLPLRDPWVTAMHVAAVGFSVWLSLRLFERALVTLGADAGPLPARRRVVSLLAAAMTLVSLVFLFGPTVLDWLRPIAVENAGAEVRDVSGIKPKDVPWLVADLEDGDLAGAVLNKADLRFAYGHRASLVGANLKDAQMRGADFQRADFRRALLEDTGMQEMNLDSANFESACLRKSDLSASDMEDADLRGAYLGLARLNGAYLGRALLHHANLQGADLGNADLSDAILSDTSFYCYALHRDEPDRRRNICPDMGGTILTGARFKDADLRFVRNLTQAQLDGACGTARLPDGLSLARCEAEPEGPLAMIERDLPPPPAADNPCRHEILSDFWIPGNRD